MSLWTEYEPSGPQKAGDAGGDFQVGEAWARKWWRQHPDGSGRFLTIEYVLYAVRERGRRYIEWQISHEIWGPHFVPDGSQSDPEREHTETAPGALDGPDDEPWPTNHDIHRELARVREPHDWNGD